MAHERKRTITFFITSKCNLNCVYCVNDTRHAGEEKTIDLNFAKKGIDDFFNDRADIFGVGNNMIRFYGIGEPTTRMDLVKSITEYAKKVKEKDLFVELQTNGFFSENTAKWIAKNVNEVWISIDGPKEIQNRNRPSRGGKETSDIVVRNIKFLQKKGIFVGARATILPQDISKQIELIDYFNSIGIKWVYAEPVFESVKQEGKTRIKQITPIDLKQFAEHFVKAYKHAENLGVHYGNFFTVNFDEPCNYACRSCLPMPQLTADGYISGCDLAYSGKTQLLEFIFGKYNKEKNEIIYYPEKIGRIRQRNTKFMEGCKNCEIRSNCGGGCAGLAYYSTGNFLGVVKEFCEATKYLAKHIPRNKGCVEHLHP